MNASLPEEPALSLVPTHSQLIKPPKSFLMPPTPELFPPRHSSSGCTHTTYQTLGHTPLNHPFWCRYLASPATWAPWHPTEYNKYGARTQQKWIHKGWTEFGLPSPFFHYHQSYFSPYPGEASQNLGQIQPLLQLYPNCLTSSAVTANIIIRVQRWLKIVSTVGHF